MGASGHPSSNDGCALDTMVSKPSSPSPPTNCTSPRPVEHWREKGLAMKLISTLAFTVALAMPAAADFTGRWEIAGRQFGMFPSFQPLNDGRLEIAAGNGANYTARYNSLSLDRK